jgi:large subunit ribosomal protein L15
MMKLKKTKKSKKMRGRGMGTHGTGARKNKRKSGNRGGKGLAGTGKRADQKKTLITKLYGHGYFGKQGITSKRTERDKRERINLKTIEKNISSYGKKTGNKWEVKLENYKILGEGDVKRILIIHAKEASKSAVGKVKKAGGEIILKKKENDKVKKI